MLNIYYGPMEGVIYNTSVFFDNTFLGAWLEDDISKKIIKSVDKGIVVGTKAIETKALGVIPVTKLSGGTKTLLLMRNKPEKIYNASTCGDNCAAWILRIAKELSANGKDLTINLRHIMDFGDRKFEAKILNNGKIVQSMSELVMYAGAFLDNGDVI